MVKSSKSHLDEEDVTDDYDSSSYREEVVKGAECKSSSEQQKASSNRSKHSETEQRRRIKINERFQVLRNLIPQNDQRRDKASFLLEVIEYIQFLQEKLQMYEGPYEGWSQEPTKLIPWKNYRASAESLVDHTQVNKNASAQENIAMLENVQNSLESDLDTAAIFKTLDHPPGSTNSVIPFNVQTQSNLFAAVGRSLQESVSNTESTAYELPSQPLHGRPCISECTTTNALNIQEDFMNDNQLINTSNAYSQGVLNTLTQVLQSSGVDLSETSISVQIDVGRRATNTTAVPPSNSKVNHYLSNQAIEQTGVGSYPEDSDQAHKRLRR